MKKKILSIIVMLFVFIGTINANAVTKDSKERLLYLAIEKRDYETSMSLIKQNTDLNDYNVMSHFPALWTAAQVDFQEIMGALVENGAEVNLSVNGQENALFVAIDSAPGTPETRNNLVQKLLNLEADPNASSKMTKITLANIGEGRIKVKTLQLLIDNGLDPKEAYESSAEFIKKSIRNPRVLKELKDVIRNAYNSGPYAMVRNLEHELENGKEIYEVMNNDPNTYNKENIEKLITFAVKRDNISIARDMLSKASLMIDQMSGVDKTTLLNKLNSADEKIKDRPLKRLVNRIDQVLNPGIKPARIEIAYAMMYISEQLEGKLNTPSLARIVLGTKSMNGEDSILFQALALNYKGDQIIRIINQLRIKVLGNNSRLDYENSELFGEYSCVNYQLTFTNFFMGYGKLRGLKLPPLTKESIEFFVGDNAVDELIKKLQEDVVNRSIKRLPIITEGLTRTR